MAHNRNIDSNNINNRHHHNEEPAAIIIVDEDEVEEPMAAAATPLLFLLDGCLSQDEDRVAEAVAEIRQLGVPLSLQLPSNSPCRDGAALCHVLYRLLHRHPAYCQYRSEHDGSLPLHFAASLGNVEAARIIFEKVRVCVFMCVCRCCACIACVLDLDGGCCMYCSCRFATFER